MLPDRTSNPGPQTYESDALPIAIRGPAQYIRLSSWCMIVFFFFFGYIKLKLIWVMGHFSPIPIQIPGRFSPILFLSGCFCLGRFRLISGQGWVILGRFW